MSASSPVVHLIGRLMALALLLSAGTAPAAQWRPVEGAHEARALHFEPSPAAPTHVRLESYDGAAERRLELARDFTLQIRGEPVPRSILPQRDGRPGTVIYDLESRRVVRILW